MLSIIHKAEYLELSGLGLYPKIGWRMMKWLARFLSTVDYEDITDEVALTLIHQKILRQKKGVAEVI